MEEIDRGEEAFAVWDEGIGTETVGKIFQKKEDRHEP